MRDTETTLPNHLFAAIGPLRWADQIREGVPLPALPAMPPVPVLLEIGLMDLLKETYRLWAMHREFRTVLGELNAYSDRELGELGLSRSDVVRVAYEEAERRIGPSRHTQPAGNRHHNQPAPAR